MVVHYKQFQSIDSITDMSRIPSKWIHAILEKHCKVSPHILTELQFPLWLGIHKIKTSARSQNL